MLSREHLGHHLPTKGSLPRACTPQFWKKQEIQGSLPSMEVMVSKSTWKSFKSTSVLLAVAGPLWVLSPNSIAETTSSRSLFSFLQLAPGPSSVLSSSQTRVWGRAAAVPHRQHSTNPNDVWLLPPFQLLPPAAECWDASTFQQR